MLKMTPAERAVSDRKTVEAAVQIYFAMEEIGQNFGMADFLRGVLMWLIRWLCEKKPGLKKSEACGMIIEILRQVRKNHKAAENGR